MAITIDRKLRVRSARYRDTVPLGCRAQSRVQCMQWLDDLEGQRGAITVITPLFSSTAGLRYLYQSVQDLHHLSFFHHLVVSILFSTAFLVADPCMHRFVDFLWTCDAKQRRFFLWS